MMNMIPVLVQDHLATQRVARVLLKHTQPETKEQAEKILNSRLGVYISDKSSLNAEIEKYFA